MSAGTAQTPRPRRPLADRSVTTKITAAVLAASAVAVGVGAVGVVGMQRAEAEVEQISGRHVAGMRDVATARWVAKTLQTRPRTRSSPVLSAR